MKNILITGGAGYIGSVLVGELLKLGHKVKIIDRLFFGVETINNYIDNPDFTLIKDDIRYTDIDVFKNVDVVFDLAGISNDPSCDLNPKITKFINFRGCEKTALLAKKAGVSRYVYSSSCSVYGAGKGLFLNEESPKSPISLYAQLKLKSEKNLLKLQDKKFCVTIHRNATVYGLSSRMRFDLVINLMALHAVKKKKIYILGGGKQWRPNLHILDVAKGFILSMQAEKDLVCGEIFNIGSNAQNYQIGELALLVQEIMPDIIVETVADDPDKRDYKVDFIKAEKILKFKPEKTIKDGIVEIKNALERDIVRDDIKTITVKYYKYLLEADSILKKIKYRGRIF